jgi:hypothetical protein
MPPVAFKRSSMELNIFARLQLILVPFAINGTYMVFLGQKLNLKVFVLKA